MVATRAKATGTQPEPDTASPQLPKAGRNTKAGKRAKAPKTAKAAKVGKSKKAAKAAKSKTNRKATKHAASTVVVEVTAQHSEDEREEEYTPQPKRRKIETPVVHNSHVENNAKQPVRKATPNLQIGKWDYIKEIPIPEALKKKSQASLPQIYIGGSAPQPRWVVARCESIPAPRYQDPSEITQIKSRKTYDASEFGGPQWALDEGDHKLWGGLEYQVLYELAYLCLEHFLNDAGQRKEICATLANGPLSNAVTPGQEWYPALPPPPFTKHFAMESSEQVCQNSSDNSAFYFGLYARPPVAVRPAYSMARPYYHAISTAIYNRPRLQKWPTASRSPSPDRHIQEDTQGDSDSRSRESKRSTVDEESDLERSGGSTCSEPAGPVPLGNNGKAAKSDNTSVDGSIFGDDPGNDSQPEHNSVHDSREQSPDSLLSSSTSASSLDSNSEGSVSFETSMANPADNDSAQPGNAQSAASQDRRLDAGQIEECPSNSKSQNLEQAGSGGLEHHKSQQDTPQMPSPDLEMEELGALKSTEKDVEMCDVGSGGSPRPSSPTAQDDTAAELRAFARVVQGQRDAMQAAAAKGVPGDRWKTSEKQNPTADIPPHLQDLFFEHTKSIINDPIQRQRLFPDPLAVRRIRVWAGEDLIGHEIKPIVDAALPPWAGSHRPFQSWQDPTGIVSTRKRRTNSTRNANRKRIKKRSAPAPMKEQSVSSARWSSFR